MVCFLARYDELRTLLWCSPTSGHSSNVNPAWPSNPVDGPSLQRVSPAWASRSVGRALPRVIGADERWRAHRGVRRERPPSPRGSRGGRSDRSLRARASRRRGRYRRARARRRHAARVRSRGRRARGARLRDRAPRREKHRSERAGRRGRRATPRRGDRCVRGARSHRGAATLRTSRAPARWKRQQPSRIERWQPRPEQSGEREPHVRSDDAVNRALEDRRDHRREAGRDEEAEEPVAEIEAPCVPRRPQGEAGDATRLPERGAVEPRVELAHSPDARSRRRSAVKRAVVHRTARRCGVGGHRRRGVNHR